ncbi:hypothetical protein [Cupriavidus pauculus]|uniref:Uncharacterized protein n=1 Tax=Cupriavidus pauculus TaxID=82633 RepID=A0A2N5CE57_9BURK|nr:hypothetical protein [Cupriavidus pauculus]PLQ00530.1 hypothetical protein CYJ10_08600 [Cupriavidus pauculus]
MSKLKIADLRREDRLTDDAARAIAGGILYLSNIRVGEPHGNAWPGWPAWMPHVALPKGNEWDPAYSPMAREPDPRLQ